MKKHNQFQIKLRDSLRGEASRNVYCDIRELFRLDEEIARELNGGYYPYTGDGITTSALVTVLKDLYSVAGVDIIHHGNIL